MKGLPKSSTLTDDREENWPAILRLELRPTLRLAGPLVLAELSWVAMGVADTMMVGRLPNGPEAIAATSLGNVLFYVIGIFGGGMLLGLDTLVSQSHGAGRVDDCHRSLVTAIYLVAGLTPLLMLLVWLSAPLLERAGIAPFISAMTMPYLWALLWSAPPLMLYIAFRRYLQGMNLVRPVAFAMVSANLVNVFGNWLLIYGRLGAPAMGVEGAGWATCIARTYMAGTLLCAILYYDRAHRMGLRAASMMPDFGRLRRLLALGLPASMHMTLEVGVFAAATTLVGRLGAVVLAAHQVALHTATVTFMVPLGISAAAAVRVGHALGRRDPKGAAGAGWTAIALGAGFMGLSAIGFLLAPRAILSLYTPNAAVLEAGVPLLVIAAFFQIFDGIQGVTIGALRGTGDTRTPMWSHLVADWLIGLPVGYYLCFHTGSGAAGLWVGLSLAMILAGIVLLIAWRRRARGFGEKPSVR
jgi:MATE family multidrug resistance protein